MTYESAQPFSVLVIEDEILLLEAITRKLNSSGALTISCTTGKQALGYLANLATLPDVIWLDYYLKDMNGLEFIREVKENPAFSKIPIVIVSNSASPDVVHTMLTLGAKKYLLKADYKLEELIKVMHEVAEAV